MALYFNINFTLKIMYSLFKYKNNENNNYEILTISSASRPWA